MNVKDNINNKSSKINIYFKLIIIIIIIFIVTISSIYLLKPYIKYKNAVTLLNNQKYYEAQNEFIELGNFLNSKEKINETNYLSGKELIEKEKYLAAIFYFEQVVDYKDSNELLSESRYLLAKESILKKDYATAKKQLQRIGKYKDSNELLVEVEKNPIIQNYSSSNKKDEKILPKIGMTSKEVENSIWGKPEKINKMTTAYSITEQWVYPNYKYVYLENDIVTAIQE